MVRTPTDAGARNHFVDGAGAGGRPEVRNHCHEMVFDPSFALMITAPQPAHVRSWPGAAQFLYIP